MPMNRVPFQPRHSMAAFLKRYGTEAQCEAALVAVASTAQLVSDGLGCFGAVTLVGATHERMVTGGDPTSTKVPQLKAINTVLGNLKTALAGTHHAIDFAKYAHRDLAEVQYRFNRRFNLATNPGASAPGHRRCPTLAPTGHSHA